MYEKQIQTIKQRLQVKENTVFTTSIDMGKIFEKEHKNVIQSIELLDCPEEFGRLNFQPTYYTDTWNRKMPMYNITRKGFVLLAMGYTGKRAMAFKIAYIEAFDLMEKELIDRENDTEEAHQLRHKAYQFDMLCLFQKATRFTRKDFMRVMGTRKAGLAAKEAAIVLNITTRTYLRYERTVAALFDQYRLTRFDRWREYGMAAGLFQYFINENLPSLDIRTGQVH